MKFEKYETILFTKSIWLAKVSSIEASVDEQTFKIKKELLIVDENKRFCVEGGKENHRVLKK